MEILTETVETITFYHPTGDASVSGASYSVNGGTPVAMVTTSGSGLHTAKLPYFGSETTVVVTWSFTVPGSGTFDHVDTFHVVRPYLNMREVKVIWPEATDAQAREVEAVVRHVINSHCGQSFGKRTATISVEAHGETALRLPERLVSLTGLSTLTQVLNPNAAIIVSDGWYIKKKWSDTLSDIESDSEYWGSTEHGGVIYAPTRGSGPNKWRDDYPFSITGVWGYDEVPHPVKEAAKLLVNDYACGEIIYRDRYLESIKAADWRLQFSSRAWEATGNVRADQLLSPYVLLQWAII